MKAIDLSELDNLPGMRLKDGGTFRFRCHSGLDCFNRCCRNLNLFLYPYDVIRLKNSLGISSDRFLDEHVDVVLRPGSFFPEVLLQMAENEERTCPFLTTEGCSVYPDRPDACRTFPVEQGVVYHGDSGEMELIHLFRPPEFCLGRHEDQELTIESWREDQEAGVHNQMTLLWAELKAMFQSDPWQGEGPDGPRGKMAFMAVYNVDRFRSFVFESSFTKRYKVKKEHLRKMQKDDVALMKFGFRWVKLYLWGIADKRIRPRA